MKIKYFNKKTTHSQGFTLVEIAIVLVIFGLLLAMFLSPLTAQRDFQNRAKTQVLLNEAKEALMGYAVTNGYLPCPDTDAVPNGIEKRKANGSCNDDKGTLPWNTLDIDSVDAWNHYFHYRVDTTFSNSVTFFTINNGINASSIQITGENGALVSTNSRPIAVIISHGTNGFGALNTGKTSPANQQPQPSGADEFENANNDVKFVSHTPTLQGSADEFDDMLVWISPKVLINRMIVAERLP